MNLVDQLARALLYEGYLLYPYRADAVKNRRRFTFGVLAPPDFCRGPSGTDASSMQTECLVESTDEGRLTVRVRFLHLMSREVERRIAPAAGDSSHDGCYEGVESLEVDGHLYQTWQEAVEREVTIESQRLGQLAHEPFCQHFQFPRSEQCEPLLGPAGRIVGRIRNRQQAVEGAVLLAAEPIADGLHKVRIEIENDTPAEAEACTNREEALLYSMASTHTILQLEQAQFVSLLEPDDQHAEAAAACRNIGAWPVLVGQPPERDTMLASPIILYDYPQIAPESPGDLCDGTEIDEILMLRIMTLSDEEKSAMRTLDSRSREILDRTELVPQEQFMKLHGAIRGMRPMGRTT